MSTNTRFEDMKMAPREAFRRSRKMYEPSGSRKLEALRQKPFRVAVYNCYEVTESSLTLRKAPLEEILYGTPAWVPMGVFMDQCGQNSDWASRPVLSAMIREGWYDLILCKSVSHLHPNIVEAARCIACLEKNGIPVYFEAEDLYTRNHSDILNLTVGANLELLQEKAIQGRRRMNQRLSSHEILSLDQEVAT